MFDDWPLRLEAAPLVEYALGKGYQTALITGSFDLFAKAIARKLSVLHWYANTPLEWDSDGQLADFHYTRDQAALKLLHLQEFASSVNVAITDCIAIGDGDNDVEVFKATGHGIAVGSDNQALINVSWRQAKSLAEVIEILKAEP